MTIADISTVTSVTFLETVDFDLSSYPNVVAWIKKMKAQPFFEECNAGFQEFKELIKSGFFKKWNGLNPGPRLNIKTVFPRYGDSHVKHKTVGDTVLSLTWESLYW